MPLWRLSMFDISDLKEIPTEGIDEGVNALRELLNPLRRDIEQELLTDYLKTAAKQFRRGWKDGLDGVFNSVNSNASYEEGFARAYEYLQIQDAHAASQQKEMYGEEY